VFSFGMVMIEVWASNIVSIDCVVHLYKVLSGAAPFPDSPPTSVMARVLLGERPERPKVPILTDRLWDLIQRCLERNPQWRPGIADVIRDLQGALVVWQRDDTDLSGFTKTNDTTLRSARQQGLLYRASSFVTPPEVTPTGLKGTSTFAYRLVGRRRPNEPLPKSGPASDGIYGIGFDKAYHIRSGDPVHGIHRIKLEELDTPVVVQPTLSRLRELLRRAGSWLLNSDTPSPQDHYQGRVPEKSFPDLTAFIRRQFLEIRLCASYHGSD